MRGRVPDVDDTSALIVEATGLGWLGQGDDADWDQCVHGIVTCTVGSIAITSRECNLTAASLFLLRTLEHDHTDMDAARRAPRILELLCSAYRAGGSSADCHQLSNTSTRMSESGPASTGTKSNSP
jgi:hypothetical protein